MLPINTPFSHVYRFRQIGSKHKVQDQSSHKCDYQSLCDNSNVVILHFNVVFQALKAINFDFMLFYYIYSIRPSIQALKWMTKRSLNQKIHHGQMLTPLRGYLSL